MTEYNEHDLNLAKEIGHLTAAIEKLDDKLSIFMVDTSEHRRAVWERLEKHGDKLNDHSGVLKWVIGIGIGIQAAWAFLLSIFKGGH